MGCNAASGILFSHQSFALAGLNSSGHVKIDYASIDPMKPVFWWDASKAKRVLNWQPTISINSLVEETVAHDRALLTWFFNLH